MTTARRGTPRRERQRYHRFAASMAYNPGSIVEKYSLKREVIDSIVISQQDDVKDRFKLFDIIVGVRQRINIDKTPIGLLLEVDQGRDVQISSNKFVTVMNICPISPQLEMF